MVYIFAERVPGDFLDQSNRLKENLPENLKHLSLYPAEIVDDVDHAVISLIALIQKWRQLRFVILDETGKCLDAFFY